MYSTKITKSILSFARKVQLIKPILYSIQIYWGSLYILSAEVNQASEAEIYICGMNQMKMLPQAKFASNEIPFHI